jgi:hypothetical protein
MILVPGDLPSATRIGKGVWALENSSSRAMLEKV